MFTLSDTIMLWRTVLVLLGIWNLNGNFQNANVTMNWNFLLSGAKNTYWQFVR